MTKPRIALSHSRLSDFNQCPRKYNLKYITKVPNFKEDESLSPHLVRGNNVHKALENYIIKKNSGEQNIRATSLVEVENTRPLIDTMFNHYDKVLPEAQVSINDEWQQVDWFSKTTFYRAIFDMICVRSTDVSIFDFKTGKLTDYTPKSGFGQLELSAAIALSIWPKIPVVNTVYLYVDHKVPVKKVYTQEDRPKLVQWFKKESEVVNAEEKFEPTPNEFCKWCPATKLQCPYSRKL